MMVGLPGSNRDIEKEIYTKTLWEDRFSPDALKIYPCLLLNPKCVNQEGLRNLYTKGIWTPIDYDGYLSFLFEISSYIPRYVHINRIQRVIPEEKIEAGIGQEIDRQIFSSSSKCLWQRSVANKLDKIDIPYPDYRIIHYPQGNKRYCFEVVFQDDIVLGYARFDLTENNGSIIRDIRVLGNMLLVGEKNRNQDCQPTPLSNLAV